VEEFPPTFSRGVHRVVAATVLVEEGNPVAVGGLGWSRPGAKAPQVWVFHISDDDVAARLEGDFLAVRGPTLRGHSVNGRNVPDRFRFDMQDLEAGCGLAEYARARGHGDIHHLV